MTEPAAPAHAIFFKNTRRFCVISFRNEIQSPPDLSEQETKAKLNVTLAAADTRNDLSELSGCDVRYRRRQSRMIEDVVKLSTELNVVLFLEPSILNQ